MPIVRLLGPAVEPLTVAEASEFLRAAGPDDEAQIAAMIASARRMIERHTGQAFINQQWKLFQPYFSGFRQRPVSLFWGTNYCETRRSMHGTADLIELPFSPLVSIDEVSYFDKDGVNQILDPSTYTLGPSAEATNGSLVLATGKSWPVVASRPDAVSVNFTAGYGLTAASVPEDMIQALRFAIAHYYDNRKPVEVERATLMELPLTLRDLMTSFRMSFVA